MSVPFSPLVLNCSLGRLRPAPEWWMRPKLCQITVAVRCPAALVF